MVPGHWGQLRNAATGRGVSANTKVEPVHIMVAWRDKNAPLREQSVLCQTMSPIASFTRTKAGPRASDDRNWASDPMNPMNPNQ